VEGAYQHSLPARVGHPHVCFFSGVLANDRVNQIQMRFLPSILEKAVLNVSKEIFALWLAVITEIIKRRDVRKVHCLIAPFIPVGNSPRTVSPLADTALYLTTPGTHVSIQGSSVETHEYLPP